MKILVLRICAMLNICAENACFVSTKIENQRKRECLINFRQDSRRKRMVLRE
jgi:hypothetical protein